MEEKIIAYFVGLPNSKWMGIRAYVRHAYQRGELHVLNRDLSFAIKTLPKDPAVWKRLADSATIERRKVARNAKIAAARKAVDPEIKRKRLEARAQQRKKSRRTRDWFKGIW